MNEHLNNLFSSVMENNKQRILRICWAYSHNIEDQKDLLQEVALNIWKSLPSFRDHAHVNTWVYRIALNVCMQYALKLSKTKSVTGEIEGISIQDEADLEQNLEQTENTKKLFEAISQLSPTEKALVLLYLEDLPYKVIAQITGIKESYVAVQMNRIKKKLYNHFNDKQWTTIS